MCVYEDFVELQCDTISLLHLFPIPQIYDEQNLPLLIERLMLRLCIQLHTSKDILGTPHGDSVWPTSA